MVITGQTTIEHWLDDDTVSYVGACVILYDLDNAHSKHKNKEVL